MTTVTPEGLKLAECSWCDDGPPIVWARTANGKAIPINYPADPAGNVELIMGPGVPFAKVHGQGSTLFDDHAFQPWMPHHATCSAIPANNPRLETDLDE